MRLYVDAVYVDCNEEAITFQVIDDYEYNNYDSHYFKIRVWAEILLEDYCNSKGLDFDSFEEIDVYWLEKQMRDMDDDDLINFLFSFCKYDYTHYYWDEEWILI